MRGYITDPIQCLSLYIVKIRNIVSENNQVRPGRGVKFVFTIQKKSCDFQSQLLKKISKKLWTIEEEEYPCNNNEIQNAYWEQFTPSKFHHLIKLESWNGPSNPDKQEDKESRLSCKHWHIKDCFRDFRHFRKPVPSKRKMIRSKEKGCH